MAKNIENKFSHQGGTVRLLKIDSDQVRDELAPAVYTVMFNPQAGEFFLETTQERFKLPKQIYGTTPVRAERVLRSYHERNKNTGLLLTGNKGSGKTMLAEVICNRLLDEGVPVVMVNGPYHGPEFNDFMTSLGECVVMIDEFTKVYNTRENDGCQAGLLTLMDGIGAEKKMFILTENYTNRINEFLLNRPGRLYYHFQYEKLEEETINEFCQDKGLEASVIEDILSTSRKCVEFSFDILSTIVEEHLRFGMSVDESLQGLNIEVSSADNRPMIEICKILDKRSNTEMLVLESDSVIPKPEGRHGGGYVQFYNPKDLKGSLPKGKELHEHHRELGIYVSNMKYDSYDKVVYETEDYLISAKPVIQRVNYNYQAF